MTKSIIEIVREAGFNVDDYLVSDRWHKLMERFAAAIKAAHLAELTQGVEMPEADRHVGESKFEEWYASYERQGISKQVARDAYAAGMGEYCFTLNQCQQAVASAVAREREACAALCEQFTHYGEASGITCVHAIRARSNT